MTTIDTGDNEAVAPDNVMSLHEANNEGGYRVMPHNYEAEMALIGAILANNRAYERVQEFLLPGHFADPAHARVFEACARLIDRGQIVDPVTLKNYFNNDEA